MCIHLPISIPALFLPVSDDMTDRNIRKHNKRSTKIKTTGISTSCKRDLLFLILWNGISFRYYPENDVASYLSSLLSKFITTKKSPVERTWLLKFLKIRSLQIINDCFKNESNAIFGVFFKNYSPVMF